MKINDYILRNHNIDEYQKPSARFFYVSFGIISNDGNNHGYTCCTSITTYNSLPNLKKLENNISSDGEFRGTVLNIIEMNRDEFVKFTNEYNDSVVSEIENSYTYPATFEDDDEDGFVVTFRDVPAANTQGYTFESAVIMAQDALLTILIDEDVIPQPSKPQNGDVMITVTLG